MRNVPGLLSPAAETPDLSLSLPTTATAPFCPPEVAGSVSVPSRLSRLGRFARHLGPGLLVAVGYMDPGNWATDIEAGSRFGYALLCVVLLSGVFALFLQTRAARLGIVTGKDLARLARDNYPRPTVVVLWAAAEVSILATDIAEVLGSALALKLLLGLPLWAGVALTGLDMLLVLGLKGQGFRTLEAIVLALVLTIAAAFAVELAFFPPQGGAVVRGLLPSAALLQPGALYVAIGIVGATVMPHNLYLHSAVVQTRAPAPGAVRESLRFASADVAIALALATLVNGAILMVSASAFHALGGEPVREIDDAYRLLAPLAGTGLAALLFGIALFAAGQSSTITGTIAGQTILEGFLDFYIPCWLRRLITRGLAILPALAGVLWLDEGSVGRMLVLTQVVLSLGLPFALWPLLQLGSNRRLMGEHANSRASVLLGWTIFALILAANAALLLGG